MNKKITVIITLLLFVSFIFTFAVCSQTEIPTKNIKEQSEPSSTPNKVHSQENIKKTIETHHSPSVDPTLKEHGVYVTEEDNHNEKPTFNVKMMRGNVEPSKDDQVLKNNDKPSQPQIKKEDHSIERDVPYHKEQNKEFTNKKDVQQERPLRRENSFRFVDGFWNELNKEFKSMSSYMNNLFSDVFNEDLNRERNNRWNTFDKLFNDHFDDDEFELPSLNSFWKRRFNNRLFNSPFRNRIENSKQFKHRHKRDDSSVFNSEKYIAPLRKYYNELFLDKNDKKSPSTSLVNKQKRKSFYGGITEGSKGYQIQLEIPDQLKKDDIKISIEKVNDQLSLVKIKAEKQYEKQYGSNNQKKQLKESGNAMKKVVKTNTNENNKQEKKGFTKVYQSYERSFTIGKPIIKEKTEAKLNEGILNLYIPKDENIKVEKEFNVDIL